MTYVIAECGINANGSLDRAKKMIDTAKLCGADCVKFQFFYKDEVKEVWDKIKIYDLGYENLCKVRDYSKEAGIDFLVSIFLLF